MYIYTVENGHVMTNKLGEKINISEIGKTQFKKASGWLVGIYMTPFDVHFNYAPIHGRIECLKHYQAQCNIPMVDLWEYINFALLRRAVNLFSRKFHFVNERVTLQIQNNKIACCVILIADKFVNKISTFFEENEAVQIGQKISFIARGSQVDLFIPKVDLRIKVKVGRQVYGSETILAEYD